MGNEGNDFSTSFLKKLRQIVLDNLNNEQFGVEDLAEAYGLSRSQLHKNLKKQSGKSVSQFIREVRLEEAKKLLEQEDVTASEVAYQVGFSSATYFNTRFKDYFGYPPGEVKIRATYEKNHPENHSNGTTGKTPSTSTKQKKWLLGALGLLLLIAAGVFLTKKKDGSEKIARAVNESLTVTDAISNEKSIAVLPLKNWSGNENLEYVSDGLTDALISKLASVSSLSRVIPFTSMLTYKKTDKKIEQIATEQNVSHVLQGSFQVSGNTAKIALQLIDGSTNDQVWSSEYSNNWRSTEIFSLQEMVSKNVLNALELTITEQETKRLNLDPTDNFEAYNAFLLAEFQRYQYKKSAFDNAIPLYEKAIALDSSFVEPYGSLAQIYIYQGLIWGLESEQDSWNTAKELLQKAFSFDPDNEMALGQLLNGYLYFEWNFEELATLAKTIPDFDAFDYLTKIGDYQQSLAFVDEAIKNDPSVGSNYGKKAEILFLMGKREECKEWLLQHDDLFDDGFYTRESAKWHFYLGNYEKSKNKLEQLVEISEKFPPIGIWLQALHAQNRGDSNLVQEKLNILRTKFNNRESGSPGWFIALFYFHNHNPNKGFEWLNKSYERHEVEMVWLRAEPEGVN